MSPRMHPRALALALGLLFVGSACTTVIKPTRPDEPFEPVGRLVGFRFDGDRVDIREPGMPLSGSRMWEREVGNFTADKLNTLLGTDETAPAAETIVSFDLASPSAIQIGTWKEMTIEITTRLPNGQVVRSEPVIGNIDSPLEYFAVQGMTFAGSALDVAAGIASLVYVFTQNPYACGCFIGALIGGLTLNLGQSIATYLVAGSDEKRWSNLFAKALKQHAADIQRAVQEGPRAPPRREGTPAPPPGGPGPTEPPPAEPGASPPPPLLDPADELERTLDDEPGAAY